MCSFTNYFQAHGHFLGTVGTAVTVGRRPGPGDSAEREPIRHKRCSTTVGVGGEPADGNGNSRGLGRQSVSTQVAGSGAAP